MKKKIYDNSNIAESYAGVTTPLTFSFARYVYQEVYQYFSRMMGANERLIKVDIYIFEHMIEFIGYRIYYNLNSWYKMLSFFPGHKFSGGKNIISWGRTSGSALGVTYIRYFSSSGLAVDVDTIMNKKFLWRWANSSSCAYPDSYDAENILNHELGHWIGLNDEYSVANFQHATMYGSGAKGEVKKNTLSTGDASGASAIYP